MRSEEITDSDSGSGSEESESIAANGAYRRIFFNDLAGDLFYKVIKMLADLKSPQERENVLYKPDLEDKVIYPQMINITHVYSYYGAHKALKMCIDNSVPFMLSTDNESALSLCVKQADTDKNILNDILKHMTNNAKLAATQSVLHFNDQCKIQSHLRPIQY